MEEQLQEGDLAARLPDDVLADVLTLLPPCSIAVSRCVCKAWRGMVDSRYLLRAVVDLLPRSVGGIFINFHNHDFLEFLARPSLGPAISGDLDYLSDRESWDYLVKDHCNGLLLLYRCVVNPATRWWAPLPPWPSSRMGGLDLYHDRYLVYDPAASIHYEVLLIPRCPHCDTLEPVIQKSEWPPSPHILHIFSSWTGQWEERPYARQGEAAGTIASLKPIQQWQRYGGVYWHGVLYVLCPGNFIMRISLSADKFQVIKPPLDISPLGKGLCLGRSEKGLSCALVDHRSHLRVWILNESCDPMEWELKHENFVKPFPTLPTPYASGIYRYDGGLWILQDINYHKDNNTTYNTEGPKAENFAWSSDDDDVLSNDDTGRHGENTDIDILGFHPYKEVVFLGESWRRGLAYHLNSSKIQDLGNIFPIDYDCELLNEQDIIAAFPYTPCWMRVGGK